MSIPDGWYVVADARRVRRRPVGIRRFGRDLVLWRDSDGRIGCVPAACPHRGADLARGHVRNGCLECPYHGFRFDSGGACVSVPCEGPAARIPPRLRTEALPVQVEHDLVWLWFGDPRPSGPIPWFDDLGPDDAVATVTGTYACHLTRFMENAMDVHHFAFVHRWLLPFVGSWVQAEPVEADRVRIRAEGRLVAHPGERGRRPTTFSIELRMPTVVRVTTAGIDLVAAACPMDDSNTWVAARYYRPRLGRGRLARATSWFGAQADWQTAQRQDRRILESVRPVVGSPHANMAVGADRLISLWYREWLGAEQANTALDGTVLSVG